MPTAVITGGSRGIGAEITRKFHSAGWIVVVGARNAPEGFDKDSESIQAVSMDVTRIQDHTRLVEFALAKTGRLDCYINCAGRSQWKSLESISEPFLEEMLDVNLKGVLWGCQAAAEKLQIGGSIINISSLAGKRGSANNAAYCMAKFGVNGLTQSLAKELGSKGIRVNAVCPVYVPTLGVISALELPEAPPNGETVESYFNNFIEANTALKRLPTGNEVASTCLFLASPAASAITGQCINVDCGVLPQ